MKPEILSFLQSFPASVIFWNNSNESVIYANRNLFVELGYSMPDESEIPKKWTELVHLDDLAEIKKLEKNLEKTDIFSCNIRLRNVSGDWIWHSYSQSIMERSAECGVLKSIITITPNPSNDDLNASLRESNERFRTLADASFGGIGIHDKGLIIEANQELARMTGFEHSELIGMDGLLLIAPEYREMVMQRIVSGFEQPYEAVGLRKDGSTFALEIQGKQIPYQGKTVRVTEFRNIEERKRISKTLKSVEQRYENLFEFAVDGILIGDEKGVVVKANQRFLEISGRTKEDVEGSHISKLFPTDTLESKPLRFDVLQSRKTLVNERDIIKPNGERISIEMHSRMMPDGTYHSIIRDISERREAEEALIKSDRIFKHSIDMLCIAGFDGYFKTLNPAWFRILGWSEDELLSKPWIEFVHPDDRESTSNVRLSLVDGKEVYQFENRYLCKDGSFRWLSWNSFPYAGEKLIYAVARDISYRKKVEYELSTEQFFMHILMNNVTDQIYFKDLESRFIRVNQNVASRFGLNSPQEVIGKADFDFFAPEHASQAFETEKKIIETGQPVVGIEEQEKWPDGTTTWVSTTKMPLKDRNGKIVGTFGISRDITDRKKAEEELIESNARLKQLSDNLPKGIVFQVDSGEDGSSRKFTYISGGVEKIHGVTPEQVIQDHMCLYSQLLNEDAVHMMKKEEEALAGLKPLVVEVRFKAPSGEIRWALISSAPRRQPNGHLVWDGIELDITEIKHAEEAHRVSEERYRSVLSNTSLVSFVLDKNGIFTLSEGTSLKKLGLSPGQVVGMSVFDVYSDFPDIVTMSQKALNGEIQRGEIAIQEIDFDVLFTPVFDSFGTVTKVIGIANDITDAKRAKDKLYQSYAQNKALLAAIPDLMFIFTKDGVFEDFYAPSHDKLLVPPSSFLGKKIADILPDYLAELSLIHLDLLFKTNESQHYEYQLEVNGELHYYDARMEIIDQSKAITICRDITERRKSEEQVELERAYFEQLFESSPEGIVVLDTHDCVIRCNEEFSRMFGYSQVEAEGRQINDLIVPPNLAEEGLNLTYTVANGKVVMHETKRMHKNGSLIDVSILGKPIQFKGGQIAVYGIYRDITDRKKVEEELIYKNYEIEAQNEEYKLINEELHNAKEKAEESDKLKSAFLANMSHEIRTPMNGILGFSQLLVNPDIEEANTKQYVDIIQSCGNQLLTIINDLIDISKIEANQIVISEAEVDLNKLMHEQYLLFEQKAASVGINFSYITSLDDKLCTITADAARLKQIISNLLNNALKFTHHGHVKFGYNLKGQDLEFFVEDTGIGISSEHHKIIFERFRQVETKLSAQAGGTGLGLAISKAYISKMGGDMRVVSEPHKGSTFFFTIPYKPTNVAEEQVDNWPEVIEGKVVDARIILVAEDDDVNFFYLNELLSEFDVKLIRATTGREAVELVKENPSISLVLMDIKMPDIDGWEATLMIRNIRKDLPIVAQTAYAFSTDKEKALIVGCNDYISKPIEKVKLFNILSKYL